MTPWKKITEQEPPIGKPIHVWVGEGYGTVAVRSFEQCGAVRFGGTSFLTEARRRTLLPFIGPKSNPPQDDAG